MPRKSKKPVRKQTQSPTGEVVGQVGQILLPMIAGIAATKADLTEWVYEQGLTALHLLLKEDAEEIAGPKGKHEKGRTHNHWGSTNGELSFGGRRIQVSRPRVRSKSGEEASLPHFEAFREEDPLPERVLNQILVGVSTRNYESSLDKPAAKLKSRGTSKSAASRHLVSQTTQKLEEYLLLFITLNREDFSFVIHLDRQPRTSRRREAQTGSRTRSGSRSERTLDAVEHSRTLMEWWPFLIFHRGGLRIKVINNTCLGGWSRLSLRH